MKFTESQIAFLKGETFSSGEPLTYAFEQRDRLFRTRIDWLTEICRDKRVVHVGCVDHDPKLIEHKLKRGKWVHKQLCDAAARCLGVDIDQQGIDYLRDRLGYADVVAADITASACPAIAESQWDYLVLGEVLEHINNPVAFLDAIRRHYADSIRQIIITVPNAFAEANLRASRRGREPINTDHRYWFTPYTLGKVAYEAGLTPRELLMCRNGVIKRRAVVRNARLRRRPLNRNGILMIADLGGTLS